MGYTFPRLQGLQGASRRRRGWLPQNDGSSAKEQDPRMRKRGALSSVVSALTCSPGSLPTALRGRGRICAVFKLRRETVLRGKKQDSL